MSEGSYYARLAALEKALEFVRIMDKGTFTPKSVAEAAQVFLGFTGSPPEFEVVAQPSTPTTPLKSTAYVIVDGQSVTGGLMYFNGFAGGQPAWASHIAQAIRFAREQDAAAMIDSFGGHVCHVEEREFDAWAG